MSSYVERLRRELEQIEAEMMLLLDVSELSIRKDDSDSGVVVIAPRVSWGRPNERQQRIQMELKRKYLEWYEHFDLLFSDATDEMLQEIHETDEFIRQWIEKKMVWSLSENMEKNKEYFRKNIQPFYKFLDLIATSDSKRPILIPDTNAFVAHPDPIDYLGAAGSDNFLFLLVPALLSELDRLKIIHPNDNFRSKVQSAIRRIKGWRSQGSLLEGITVNRSIKIQTIAQEPDFSRTLSWLDSNNDDDRFIATALEVQRKNPNVIVILVTGDINLQNKAEAAHLPYFDLTED